MWGMGSFIYNWEQLSDVVEQGCESQKAYRLIHFKTGPTVGSHIDLMVLQDRRTTGLCDHPRKTELKDLPLSYRIRL